MELQLTASLPFCFAWESQSQNHLVLVVALCLYFIIELKDNLVIDAREAAPASASKDMFHRNEKLASDGPLSIAVPG